LARDRELLCWQYPYLEDSEHISMLIAEEGDTLVGMLGVIPVGFCVRGECLPGAWLTTWKVVPEWRDRALGLRLLRRAMAEDYVVGLLGGNEKTAMPIYRALRFDIWNIIPRWVRVVSPSALESLLAERAGLCSQDIWKTWCSVAQLDISSTKGRDVRLVGWSEKIDKQWDRTWQEKFAPRLLGTWRDANYLRWRYVNHPCFRYVLHFAKNPESDTLEGLLVYRIEKVRDRDEKVLRIVEFLSEEAVGGVLAQAAVEAGEAEGVAFADFFCISEAFAAPLEAVGFVREDKMSGSFPMLFQPLDFRQMWLNGAFWVGSEIARSNRNFFRTPHLYVTSSDGDQDRPN